jgi:polyhydroxyalkanoate synthase
VTVDRRLAPRPLPAHLASAMMLWHSSLLALPSLSAASTGSKLAGLGGEIARRGVDAVAAALAREVAASAAAMLDGLEAYRRHPYRRAPPDARVMWCEGTTRLLDYRGEGLPVLLIPSLINRYYVLDLLPGQSFVAHLAAAGLRPLVVDWGAPGPRERQFTLTDYIAGRLDRALSAVRRETGRRAALAGYCMGGLLALALALRRPDDVAGLALLATPWDFHAERRAEAAWLGGAAAGIGESLPVEAIQALFFALDPLLAERKFRRFAALDPAGEAARVFVALEDWINDGVPLAGPVAAECFGSWYGANDPAGGRWRVAGRPVVPGDLECPALVVVPSRDRIVPPRSAAALAAALPQATVLRPPLGHIGMMAGGAARAALWSEIARWLAGF